VSRDVLNPELSNNLADVHIVLAQNFASHGTYTEPNTGINFYTSYENNGTVTGDGEYSLVSWGGFTSGVALPENALTVSATEYIGLIVSLGQ